MKSVIRVLACCLVLLSLCACGSSKEPAASTATGPPPNSPTKIRVVDVSNNTGELFDVDVIGLLWSGLDDALKKRGMFWTPDSPNPPLTIEAQVVKYKKGSAVARGMLVPYWGNTVLVAKCELKEGDRVIASAESKQSVSLGHGGISIGGWRKVFSAVGEELVSKVARPM